MAVGFAAVFIPGVQQQVIVNPAGGGRRVGYAIPLMVVAHLLSIVMLLTGGCLLRRLLRAEWARAKTDLDP